MAVWFISRHLGAIEWAKTQNLNIDHWVEHLDYRVVQAGDVVMGTLPVHLEEKICQQGAAFYFLSVDVQPDQRGQELTQKQLEQQDCQLIPFYVECLE